ncbi:hypothetical protein Tco_0323101 [Tanacetum coccineum]
MAEIGCNWARIGPSNSGSGLTADSSVLTLTLTFLDFGLDFAQSFPFHAQFCHFGSVFCNTLQSDEDGLKLNELMEQCTTLQNRVLDLEKTKTTQQNKIASLKRRVKKLEKKNRSRTHKLKRLYKVGLTARVESSGDEEDLDDADNEMYDVNVLNGEEVFVAGQNENVVEEVVDVAQVSTTAKTVTITTKEITLAQALEALKTSKPKVKGIVFQEPSTTTTITTTISSQQSQDKEWDDIQAKIDADHQLTQRLQPQEQEELSDVEKATLFQQLLEKRRKYFAAKRVEERRNKPPIKAQQRQIMSFKRVNTFEDFRTELVEGKEKRAVTELVQEIIKMQKVENNKEIAELKQLMKIIPDEEVSIDAIPLAVNQMLKSFDKEDLEDLYKLVKARYGSTRPVESMDYLLWNDMKQFYADLHVGREEVPSYTTHIFDDEIATYGRIWYDDDVHDLRSVETEFPAIVFNDTLTPKVALSCEPTLSSLYNNEIDFRISFDESDDEDYTPTVSYFDDLDYLKDFEKEFSVIVYNDALTSKSDFLIELTEKLVSKNGYDVLDMTLPPRDQRYKYLRFEGLEYNDSDIMDFEERLGKTYGRGIHQVLVLDFECLPAEMAEGLTSRMLMEHRDAQGQTEEMETVGFGLYWAESSRQIFNKDDLSAYWSIAWRSRAPEKVTLTYLFYLRRKDVGSVNIPYLLARYLRMFASGRKHEEMISKG